MENNLINVHHNVNLSISHETYLVLVEAQKLWPRRFPTVETYIIDAAFAAAQHDIEFCEVDEVHGNLWHTQ